MFRQHPARRFLSLVLVDSTTDYDRITKLAPNGVDLQYVRVYEDGELKRSFPIDRFRAAKLMRKMGVHRNHSIEIHRKK